MTVIPGTRLGSYEIEALLGAGGLGIVYRARDTKLRRSVAIKFLSSVAEDDSRERLLHEARAASALNHPNICTIYEVCETDAAAFIVMELVEGKPLSELVNQRGLPLDTAIRHAIQITDALAHAHSRGVVHRDLKGSNIVITSDGRAKVLDFGLARRLPVSDLDAVTRSASLQLEEPGGLSGTLAYMAPELLRGASADPRSEVWAFGVVFHQMLVGALPFTGSTSFELTAAILDHPPRRLPDQIPGVVRRIAERCLEKNPAQRYQRASEVHAALETIQVGRPGWHNRWVTVAAVALAVGIIVVGGWMLRSSSTRHPAVPSVKEQAARSSPIKTRRSVAVFGFENLSKRADAAWLSTAFSEMLTTELAAGEQLRAIPTENVVRTIRDLSLVGSASFARDTLAHIRARLGTDIIVSGSYVALGERAGSKIRVDLRLQDATAAETVAVFSETGTEAHLLDLISAIGERVRRTLGVSPLTAAEKGSVQASLPSNVDAARLYTAGVGKLRVFDALEARDLLERAVAVDPQHVLAYSTLAEAWSRLGYDGKAQWSARKALDLSEKLPREEHLVVEARYHEVMRDWDKATDIYRTLFGLFADNLEYGLRLAAVQTSAGAGAEALKTIERLRRLPAPARDDLRIDLAEAGAAASLGDFKRQAAAATASARKAASQHAQLLLAAARFQEGAAADYLSEKEVAAAKYEESRAIYAAARDVGSAARTLNSIAGLRLDQGAFDEAKPLLLEVLQTARKIGDRKTEMRSLNSLGIALAQQDRLDGARRHFEQALAIARETDNRSAQIAATGNIANLLARKGQLTAAMRSYEEGLALNRALGDRHGEAWSLVNICNVSWQLGELAAARRSCEQALAAFQQVGRKEAIAEALNYIGDISADQGQLVDAIAAYERATPLAREVGDQPRLAWILHGMASVMKDRGDLARADALHREALGIRQQLGNEEDVFKSRLALASVALEQGRITEAEQAASGAADYFRAENVPDDEASARVVLARVLLAGSNMRRAGSAIARAEQLSSRNQNRAGRILVAITSARVRAASGQRSRATIEARTLDALGNEAHTAGFVGLELESRLAAAEAQLRSGNVRDGQNRLRLLEEDAKKRGFLLMARKAVEAARGGIEAGMP